MKRELAECLRENGFTNVGEAVGCDHKMRKRREAVPNSRWSNLKLYFLDNLDDLW